MKIVAISQRTQAFKELGCLHNVVYLMSYKDVRTIPMSTMAAPDIVIADTRIDHNLLVDHIGLIKRRWPKAKLMARFPSLGFSNAIQDELLQRGIYRQFIGTVTPTALATLTHLELQGFSLEVDGHMLQLNGPILSYNGRSRRLTDKEKSLLLALVNAGQEGVSESALKQQQGHAADAETRAVSALVYRLRRDKLEPLGIKSFIARSKQDDGYAINTELTDAE